VIYLDAIVPNDGESANAVMGGNRMREAEGGFIVPGWVRADQPPPHDVPHPAKTLSDPVSFRHPDAIALPVTYILTVDPGGTAEADGFYGSSQRARERGWRVDVMEADHNPQWSRAEELARRLHEAPAAGEAGE
jgi:hypothetical protein